LNQARSVFFIFITLGGVFVGFSAAWSQELVPYYRGVRDEAMGGAGVAVVNDETALFINPAGLGKIRGPYLSLINPEVETNYETVSALGASASSLSGAQDPQTLLNFSMRNPDKNLHAKVQATPAFVTTNFGLGGLAKYSMDAIYSPTTATMQYNYLNDYAIAMGYCFRLFQGRIKIGLW
jgi:hypothetical protein